MNRIRDKLIIAVLIYSMLGVNAHAYVYPTYSQGRYASVINKIASVGNQIKKMSEFIGAVRDQINTLQKVSEGIRDLRGVIDQSVRGLATQISATLGVDKIMEPLSAFQDLVTDSQALLRDAKDLPEEAKRQLKDIGYSVDDVRRFLREGVVYDTFSKLGVDEWKAVAKDPVNAFKNGSVGMAISRSEGYLSEQNRGQAWHDYMAGLSEEQKANLGPLIGASYAAHLGGVWFEKMGNRTKKTADFREVGNKLSDVVEGIEGGPDKGGAAVKDTLGHLGTLTRAKNWKDKVKANIQIDTAGAQHAIGANESSRLAFENEEKKDGENEDRVKTILTAP